MGNQVDNKYTWVIKEFSSLKSQRIYSDKFVIGGCKWRLRASLNISSFINLPVYLEVADPHLLPWGCERRARYHLSILNQIPGGKFQSKEQQQWFSCSNEVGNLGETLPLSKLKAKDSGFLVDGELKIVVEVDVLEVIGRLDVPEEATQALKKRRLDVVAVSSDVRNLAMQQLNESIDVNGFLVLPSQVDIVKRIFEKYPDIALGFRPKNSNLRKACMNSLLSLIETVCQSPQEFTTDDLVEAENALTYVMVSGFKVDWLKKKLEEVKKKKKDEQTGVTRMQELEKELKEYEIKCSVLEALLKKEATKVLVARAFLAREKAKVLAARVPLTMDDVI